MDQIKTLNELARLVSEMRNSQKAYFMSRSESSLETSKRLERQVDRVCFEILNGQKELFQNED